MAVLEPVDHMREADVGLGRAPEDDKRADAHLLVVGLGLEDGLLLDAEHALGARAAVLVGGDALVEAAVCDRGAHEKERAVGPNGEAAAGDELAVLAPEDLRPRRTERGALDLDRLALDHLGLAVGRLLDLGRLGEHVQVEVGPRVAVLVGHVAREHARVRVLHVDHLEHLVVDGDARIGAQELALYRLAVHVPVDLVGRRPAVGVARERHVLAHAHVLVLGLLDPVGLGLDDHLDGGERHAELVAAAALVGALVAELHRAYDQLLALRVGRVAAVGGQRAVDLAPEHLRCRPTAEYALEAHLLAEQEDAILLGAPQLDGRLVGRADLLDLEHGELALVEQQQAATVGVARVRPLVLLVLVLDVEYVELAVVVLGDARRHGDRAELVAIAVAHHRPVDVRIGHARRRRAVEYDPVAAARAHYLVARRVGKLRELGHAQARGERQRRAVLIGGVALVPALVGRRRSGEDERAGVALDRHAVVLRARIVDALVLRPRVLGRRVAARHTRHLDVDARIEYDLLVRLTDY